jgi:HK97 family phage major capsid protein
MTAKEIREKRAKLLAQAQAIMAGENVTAEQRAQVDTMLAEANTLKADAERLEQLEAFDAENRSAGRVPRSQPGDGTVDPETDNRTPEERRRAANVALRSFLASDPEVNRRFERRDLTVAANGSVMIPVGVTDPRIARQSWGSMYDLVGKLRTATGEQVKVPLLNDVANLFVLASASITTTDPATGGVTSTVDDIRMNPILLDNSLIQDVSFDLVSYVEQLTNARYLRTASKWITLGNSSNVKGAAVEYTDGVTANTTLVTKYGDLVAMLAKLDPAYAIGAVWVMSQTTLANQVMNILDKNDRPIFLPFNDGGISGFAGTLFGYPVKINPYQPGIGVGANYVQFGNFEAGYVWREVGLPNIGVQNSLPGSGVIMLRRLDERYAELNKTGFVAFARVSGVATNPGAVPTTATPAPIVTLIGK